MKKFADAIDRINVWAGQIASFIILALIGAVIYEVVSRYLFNAPTKWSSEISQYLQAGAVLLGGGYCLVSDGHVRVDILHGKFKPGAQKWVEILTFLVVLCFTFAMIWQGAETSYEAWIHDKRSMTILEFPLFPSMVLVPIGAALLLLQSLARALRALDGLISPSPGLRGKE
jgi:TRAP-type mannitol/chloroaromatic compound transport system permease small subunit